MLGMGLVSTQRAAAILLPGIEQAVEPHVFTDDTGHKVEALPVGVRGDYVILEAQGRRGQFPVDHLKKEDERFVSQWQENTVSVAKVNVAITRLNGLGDSGTFDPVDEKTKQKSPNDFPNKNHKHATVQVTNPSTIDGKGLRMDYVFYVVYPDGSVGARSGSQALEPVPAFRTADLETEGLDLSSTKTAPVELKAPAIAAASTDKQPQLVGAWVKVSNGDCRVIGQNRDFTPDFEKLDPPWAGPVPSKEIPVLKSLDELLTIQPNLPKQATPRTKKKQ